jgi:hypothetical protein
MQARLGGDTVAFRPRAMAFDTWRVVESQFVVSTRKLVDSDEEQRLLEELIDGVKPPVPGGPEFKGLHYLLSTPFRHPPLRSGTRFGGVAERGVWYGAKEQGTCFAEVAYYRLLFLEGTAAELAPVTVELTAFVAAVACKLGVDLTKPPFAAYEVELTDKTSYRATHALGAELRAAGIEAVLFRSARTERPGTNVALFTPAFARKNPSKYQAWVCTTDRQKVELTRKTFARREAERLTFRREEFEVDGKFAVITG